MPKLRYERLYFGDDGFLTTEVTPEPVWQCSTPGCLWEAPGFAQAPRMVSKSRPECDVCGKPCDVLFLDTDTGRFVTLGRDPLAEELLAGRGLLLAEDENGSVG